MFKVYNKARFQLLEGKLNTFQEKKLAGIAENRNFSDFRLGRS